MEEEEKQGAGLSMNVIIIAAIALLVLVVLAIIFVGRSSHYPGGQENQIKYDDSLTMVKYAKIPIFYTNETKSFCGNSSWCYAPLEVLDLREVYDVAMDITKSYNLQEVPEPKPWRYVDIYCQDKNSDGMMTLQGEKECTTIENPNSSVKLQLEIWNNGVVKFHNIQVS